MPDKKDEKDKQEENEEQPTFGNFHDDVMPESERVSRRNPFKIRFVGQAPNPEEEEEELFWEEAKRRASENYERSRRLGK